MIDNERFKSIVKKIVCDKKEKNKIGLISEKLIHSSIKYYLENEENHEQKIGKFYVDILKDGHIYEIQTANFNKLREKLDYFFSLEYDVTIVYPFSHKKIIYWLDPETMELSKGRYSNRKGNFMNIFPELYKIKQYLKNDKLHFKFILINMDEYRFLNGRDKTRKIGSSRIERIPSEIVDILDIKVLNDFCYFTKCFSDSHFTTKDYKKINKSTIKEAALALNILSYLGIIERIGRIGRLYLYKNIVEEK